mmetsp:Transcript_14468/g.31800  ORF Transcript_14468/g.31800 Transcript_14468/m.31800 type:complete len:259 (+) Transcript_14468:1035-1811(+)
MVAPPANLVRRLATWSGVGPPTKSFLSRATSAMKSGSSLISLYFSVISRKASERVSGMYCPPNFPNMEAGGAASGSWGLTSGTFPRTEAWLDAADSWSHPVTRWAMESRTLAAFISVVAPSLRASVFLRMALPTTTPSAMLATWLTCSGVEMPNPTARGRSVLDRTLWMKSERSEGSSVREPVTPVLDTQYRNVLAVLTRNSIRSSVVVGAMRGMRLTPSFSQARASGSPSSGGRSTTMKPSAPAALVAFARASRPYW